MQENARCVRVTVVCTRPRASNSMPCFGELLKPCSMHHLKMNGITTQEAPEELQRSTLEAFIQKWQEGFLTKSCCNKSCNGVSKHVD